MTWPGRTLSRSETSAAVRTGDRLMAEDDVALLQPGRATHLRRNPEDESALLAPDAALRLNGGRHVDQLQVLEHRDLLGGDGGEVARSRSAAGRCRSPLRTDHGHRVAHVQVELDRLPVEIVPKPPAVGLDQNVALVAGRPAPPGHRAPRLESATPP